MRIHISPQIQGIKAELIYLFKLIEVNKRTKFEFSVSDDSFAPVIGLRPDNGLCISETFHKLDFSSPSFNDQGIILCGNGKPDYLGTAFYCVTSLQEHLDRDPDHLGRFKYKNSYQQRFNNVTRNIVQECFDQVAATLALQSTARTSAFYLSHDIDTVYGAIKEDGFYALKKGRVDLFLGMLFKVAQSRPAWLNIDQIMKIESAYDCRSTFYWIVNHGNIDSIQKNADYRFHNPVIQKNIKLVEEQGFENGLHKSLTLESLEDEIKKFGYPIKANRYHYLKFNLPQAYYAIEKAGLVLDASLGFSEHWGFRNNYGLPFNPYNFEKRQPHAFIEVPLHIMDRTFFSKRMNIAEVEKAIFDFFYANEKDCVISVLWHNNFFTEYKYRGYLPLYKKILAYIKEGGFGTLSQHEIINNYSIKWP